MFCIAKREKSSLQRDVISYFHFLSHLRFHGNKTNCYHSDLLYHFKGTKVSISNTWLLLLKIIEVYVQGEGFTGIDEWCRSFSWKCSVGQAEGTDKTVVLADRAEAFFFPQCSSGFFTWMGWVVRWRLHPREFGWCCPDAHWKLFVLLSILPCTASV